MLANLAHVSTILYADAIVQVALHMNSVARTS
jgi:hypothetical protein